MTLQIVVGAWGSRWEHLLRLEVGSGEAEHGRGFFSMTSTTLCCKTKQRLMAEAAESLNDEWEDELKNTTLVAYKLKEEGYAPEWEEDELIEIVEGDLELWTLDPQGEEWGLVVTSGGQGCDNWENFLPDHKAAALEVETRWPASDIDRGVLWFIEPEQYADLLSLWRNHHLEAGFATPQWVCDLAAKSLTLKEGFQRWWEAFGQHTE